MGERREQPDLMRCALGRLAASYLRLLRSTSRFVEEPTNFRDALARDLPIIAALWHGQHFLAHVAWPTGARLHALVSRHRDGEINVRALQEFGVSAIRGSAGLGAKARKRGGSVALRQMARALRDGSSVAMTADAPKRARVAGPGIVALARISGRPIYPIAVVTRPQIVFPSWDRASLGLPGGRGAIVLGAPIRVARDANEDALEDARRAVQVGLDAAHARAHVLIGAKRPPAHADGGL